MNQNLMAASAACATVGPAPKTQPPAQGCQPVSRRQFARGVGGAALAAAAFPAIIPASALGRDGSVAPGNRVVLGVIGSGPQGQGDMRNFLNKPDCQVAAVCDVNAVHLEY